MLYIVDSVREIEGVHNTIICACICVYLCLLLQPGTNGPDGREGISVSFLYC